VSELFFCLCKLEFKVGLKIQIVYKNNNSNCASDMWLIFWVVVACCVYFGHKTIFILNLNFFFLVRKIPKFRGPFINVVTQKTRIKTHPQSLNFHKKYYFTWKCHTSSDLLPHKNWTKLWHIKKEVQHFS